MRATGGCGDFVVVSPQKFRPSDHWIVPVGGGSWGTQLQALYNAVGPKTLRFQVQFLSSPVRLCHMKPSRSINISVLIVLTATLLAGCASGPSAPPVPITDMRQIEGKWEGLITLGFGGPQARYYLTVRPDGGLVAQWGQNWQWGKVMLSPSGATYATFEFSELTNGTLTYYDGPGGRSMVLEAYFNSWSANVTPVK